VPPLATSFFEWRPESTGTDLRQAF
jgi:hypothetical protein